MDILNLADLLEKTNQFFKSKAINAVNVSLTMRNWLFGYYIKEYEQKGADRAKYGDKLLEELSNKLNNAITGLSVTHLRIYRQFYNVYPEIGRYISDFIPEDSLTGIHQTLSDEFIKRTSSEFHQTLSDELKTRRHNEISIEPEKILKRLSFSHITELIKISDPLKRAFYEIETINGTWSVRELKRQIATLFYERSGMSQNKEKLHALVNKQIDQLQPSDILKNPFTFDFLGLPYHDVLEENKLEQALINNLQEFLLELGNGFCFESRQKRILIGGRYYFVDLVFYHRILRCHVLVELKVDEFSHEYAGQLNTYVNFYKKEIQQKSDKNPIGILMCTGSNNVLVEYATAGMNKDLFFSEYMINLPSEKELREFINIKMKELK